MAARHKGKHKARYHTRTKAAREITLPPLPTMTETAAPAPAQSLTETPSAGDHQEAPSE